MSFDWLFGDETRPWWEHERETLKDEIAQLKQQVLSLQVAATHKDQQLRDLDGVHVKRVQLMRQEWDKEREELLERLKGLEIAQRQETKKMLGQYDQHVQALTRQLEGARQALEERESSWKIERIELTRALTAKAQQSQLGEHRGGAAEVQEALRAAEEIWKTREAMLQGKILWLTEEYQALHRASEGRLAEVTKHFGDSVKQIEQLSGQREAELRGHYEGMMAGWRARQEELETLLHQAVKESSVMKMRLEQRDQAVDVMMKRNDTQEEAVKRRVELERRTWQETVEEKETVWRAHVDRLMQEIEAWKSAWETREQEIRIQLDTVHKAYRSVEGKWQARVTEIQQASLHKGRNEVINQTEQAKAFRERTADEMFNLEQMAVEVDRRLAQGGEGLKYPDIVKGKMKVFQEIREFVSHEMAEYAAHDGAAWSERTAIETAVLKALESGRFLLLNLQIELRDPSSIAS